MEKFTIGYAASQASFIRSEGTNKSASCRFFYLCMFVILSSLVIYAENLIVL